jgi:hypothetical protein
VGWLQELRSYHLTSETGDLTLTPLDTGLTQKEEALQRVILKKQNQGLLVLAGLIIVVSCVYAAIL